MAGQSGPKYRRTQVRGEAREPVQKAYLVRCWQEGGTAAAEGSLWRFSVEEILSERRRRGFRNIKALTAFFQGELCDMDSGE